MKPSNAPPPAAPHLSRTGIMLVLLPVVTAALKGIPDLKLTDVDPLRRTFRALLTIGIRLMLDAGIHPMRILEECGVAVGNELEERAATAKEDGATQAAAAA